MKKFLSLFAASAMCMCMAVSCSSPEKELIGKWEMPSLAEAGMDCGGLEFKEGGKGSLFMDTSSIIHAENKEFYVGEGDDAFVFGEEMIEFDGKTLKINVNDNDMLTMERTGKEDSAAYDGEYKMISGLLYDQIVSGLLEGNTEMKKEDLNVIMDISGKNTEMTYNDVFDYKADKKKIEITGWASFLGSADENGKISSEYSIKDGKLEIKSESGDTEKLTKMS